MSTSELLQHLDKKKQIELAINLIQIGLPIWTEYTSNNSIEYIDSVAGMHHKINTNLIPQLIDYVKEKLRSKSLFFKIYYKIRLKRLFHQFLEPKVALIDEDFELPRNMTLFFLSAYYLIEFIVEENQMSFFGNNIFDSVEYAIQAIQESNIMNGSEIENIVNEYLKHIK